MTTAIEVKISQYEFAHGKKPRGRGCWAFFMGRNTSDVLKAHFFNGTFREACKQAKAKAREMGFNCVTVGS